MKKITIFFFSVAINVFTGQALAAEVRMPVKVELVRCVTQQERVQMCHERNLCCHLVEQELASLTPHTNETGDIAPADNQTEEEIYDLRTTGTTRYSPPVKTRNVHALKITREARQVGLNTHIAEKDRQTNIIVE